MSYKPIILNDRLKIMKADDENYYTVFRKVGIDKETGEDKWVA